MPGINLKQLRAIEKSLETVFSDDDEQLEAIGKSLDGLKAAIRKGDHVTMDDVSDILGEAVIEKAVDDAAHPVSNGDEAPADPLAPHMLDLFGKIFDDKGQIRKGVSAQSAQELFEAAYHKMLGELDGAIEATAEATAIELGQGGRVNFGKHAPSRNPKKPSPGSEPGEDDDEDDDEDCDDMNKILKAAGVAPAVINKIAGLQAQVDTLQTERDLEEFGKAAVDVGEPESFGAELLKLHKIDPKLADSIKKRLGTKNAALKKGGMWAQEIGGEGHANGSALDQLNAKANEMVEKGAKDAQGRTMSFAKAFTEACNLNPDLYQEYRSEEDQKRRR